MHDLATLKAMNDAPRAKKGKRQVSETWPELRRRHRREIELWLAEELSYCKTYAAASRALKFAKTHMMRLVRLYELQDRLGVNVTAAEWKRGKW